VLKRLHVVYVDHVARLSGGEIALARMLPVIAAQVDVRVILGEDGPLVERLQSADIEVEILALPAAARDTRKDTVTARGVDLAVGAETARYVALLRRRLRALRPDILHTNSLKSAMYGGVAGRAAGIPVLWHVRDRIAADYLPGAAVRLVRTAASVLPSAVVTPSEVTMATLPARRPSIRAVVADSVDPPAGAGHRSPEPHPFRVGIVGRLAEWKGQHVVLEAFAKAFPSGGAELWLIGEAMFGEAAYVERLRRQIGSLDLADRVELRGFRGDVWAELAQLDVLVHASTSPEPFGQVVLEGMAAGLPVVAAVPGGPAEFMVDGVDGLLTPSGSVEALAAALLRLAGDPALRHRLGQNARTVAERYTPARTAQGLLDVYGQMVVKGGRVATDER
jgi:glycosyltransferase involved in cell wall biosynthesis